MTDQDDEFPPIPGLHASPDDQGPAGETVAPDDVDLGEGDEGDFHVGEPAAEETDPDIDDEPEPGVEDERGGAEGGAPGAPVFTTLEEWVEKYLLNMYRRSVDGTAMTWCPEWWRHPEAYLRLDALWRAWEYLRQRPGTGMAVWMRDYCDQHMAVLLSESGPFKGCEPGRHSPYPLQPLPTLAPPSWETLAATYGALRSREWEEE
jgi:hypothetical protein